MELTRFMQALAQRSGKLDAIETGFLLALLFLDERNGPIRGSRANQLRFHLELLDIRLAESDAPDELRQVIAGATDALTDWDRDPPARRVRAIRSGSFAAASDRRSSAHRPARTRWTAPRVWWRWSPARE